MYSPLLSSYNKSVLGFYLKMGVFLWQKPYSFPVHREESEKVS